MSIQTIIEKESVKELMNRDLGVNKKELTQFVERINNAEDIMNLFVFLVKHKHISLLDHLLTYTDLTIVKRLDVLSEEVVLRLKVPYHYSMHQIYSKPKKRKRHESNYKRSEQLTIPKPLFIRYLKSVKIDIYTEMLHAFGQGYHNQSEIINDLIVNDNEVSTKQVLLNNSLINHWDSNLIKSILDHEAVVTDYTIDLLLHYIRESKNPYPEHLGTFLYKLDEVVANLLGSGATLKNTNKVRELKQQLFKTKQTATNDKIKHDHTVLLNESKSFQFLNLVKEGDFEQTGAIINDETVDVNVQDENGKTALMHAIELKNYELVMLLLDYVDVNLCDCNLNTPLHLVYKYKDYYKTDVIEAIVRKGASIYAINDCYEVVAVSAINEQNKQVAQIENQINQTILNEYELKKIDLNYLSRTI